MKDSNRRLFSILREFPWLWAIRHEWKPLANVEVKRATPADLETYTLNYWTYWIVWVDKDGIVGIVGGWPVHTHFERPLSEWIRCSLHSAYSYPESQRKRRIIYLVGMQVKQDRGEEKIENGPIKIWRAPRDKDLHEMCKKEEDTFFMG